MAYGEIDQQVYKHSGTYAHPMNDLTTAFAVPKSEGNAQPMIFQNILQYRGVRSQSGVVRWLGGRSGNIVPKPSGRVELLRLLKGETLDVGCKYTDFHKSLLQD